MKRPRRTPPKKPKTPKAAPPQPSPRPFGGPNFDHEAFRSRIRESQADPSKPKPKGRIDWFSFFSRVLPVAVGAIAEQLSIPGEVSVSEGPPSAPQSSRHPLRLPPLLEVVPAAVGEAAPPTEPAPEPPLMLRQFALLRMRLHAVTERLKRLEDDIPELTEPDYERASSATVCSHCKFEFRLHPEHPGLPWLTVLCDGDVVKL
jgi:hypothetical protein